MDKIVEEIEKCLGFIAQTEYEKEQAFQEGRISGMVSVLDRIYPDANFEPFKEDVALWDNEDDSYPTMSDLMFELESAIR